MNYDNILNILVISVQFERYISIVGIPDMTKVGMPSHLTLKPVIFPIPQLGDLPHSLALGTVGMPG